MVAGILAPEGKKGGLGGAAGPQGEKALPAPALWWGQEAGRGCTGVRP